MLPQTTHYHSNFVTYARVASLFKVLGSPYVYIFNGQGNMVVSNSKYETSAYTIEMKLAENNKN